MTDDPGRTLAPLDREADAILNPTSIVITLMEIVAERVVASTRHT
ncbi:hypothetical protein [Salinisphaera hydrothermalis]